MPVPLDRHVVLHLMRNTTREVNGSLVALRIADREATSSLFGAEP